MSLSAEVSRAHRNRPVQRKRQTPRMLLACITCKDRKLRCDDQVPACANCQRFGLACMVEDPATKRHQPRNYLEILEQRVLHLEGLLQKQNETSSPYDFFSAESFPSDLNGDQNGASTSETHIGSQTGTSNNAVQKETSDQLKDTDDLAEKVGMLTIAAGAEPHYLGPSSAVNFCRVLSSALLQAIPRPAKSKETSASQNWKQQVSSYPCPFPDSRSCLQFSDAYFQHIHTQYPFLHEPTFREWETALLPSEAIDITKLDPVPTFFLYMVYAIGALIVPNSGYSAESLCASAQLYVDKVLQLENLEAIQAYLCYAIYSLRSPTGTSVWRFSGMALRQCVELGYHRHGKVVGLSGDPLRVELRKRVFWCAWTIDVVAAGVLGRPLGLRDEEFDCELPLDIEDKYITSYGIIGRTRGPHDPPTKMTKSLMTFRVRQLWARIHVHVYSDLALSDTSHPTYQTRIDGFRKDLEEWRASLPEDNVSATLHPDSLTLFTSSYWYDLSYNCTIMNLYREQLTYAKGSFCDEATLLECMRAAEDVCHGLRNELLGKRTTPTWGALHSCFIAGLTYLHGLWTFRRQLNYNRRETRQDVVSATCTDCTIALVLMAQWHEGAAPYRDIFEALAARTMTMLVEKDRVDLSNEQSPILHADPSEEALSNTDIFSQWMADISETGMGDSLETLLNGLVYDLPGRSHPEGA